MASAWASATTTATTAITTTAAAAAGAFLTGPGLVNRQGASLNIFAIQRLDSSLSGFGRGHRDETETTRTSGGSILHQIDFGDRAMLRKHILEIVFGEIVGQIAYVQFSVHDTDFVC
jgi:hypothetical protein